MRGMTASTPASVQHNERLRRFELDVEGRRAGLLQYRERDGMLDLLHTEVDPAFRGRGLAAALVRAALDQVRAANQRIVPSCPYVAAFVERHPEYRDIVAG